MLAFLMKFDDRLERCSNGPLFGAPNKWKLYPQPRRGKVSDTKIYIFLPRLKYLELYKEVQHMEQNMSKSVKMHVSSYTQLGCTFNKIRWHLKN
jgi:hypothetical protein